MKEDSYRLRLRCLQRRSLLSPLSHREHRLGSTATKIKSFHSSVLG